MHLKTTTLYMQNEENLAKEMETEITCNEKQVHVNLKKQTWTKTKINFTNVQINFLIENKFFNYCVCLFVWFFLSHLRIFHSYGDVTITREGPYSALMSIEHRGFFSVPRLLWQISIYHSTQPSTCEANAQTDCVIAVALCCAYYTVPVYEYMHVNPFLT